MARYPVSGVFADGVGNIVTSGTVAVFLFNSAAPTAPVTKADVYAASTGGSAVNSVTSDSSNGTYQFWVDDGDYAATQVFTVQFSKSASGGATNVLTNYHFSLAGLSFKDVTETLTNKTLTSPVLTTPQINDTSADHQYVFAVSELAADRTVTLPLLTGNDTFVFNAFAATLTNKTINGANNTVTNVAPVNYRSGLNCKQASTTTITVEAGSIDVDGTVVTKSTDTTLTLTTATDWVDDTSDRAVSKYIYIYINAAGKIELDDVAPDESDTSGNTSGILRYNDTGTDTSDRRMIGWAYLNATGSGELSTYEVGNLKDGDVHNSVLRTDTTNDVVNDTSYGADMTATQVHFYTSGRGLVDVKCHIFGLPSASLTFNAILNDGSDVVASEAGHQSNGSTSQSVTPIHAEVYAQGGVTFEAKMKVSAGTYTVADKTMIINEM